MVTSLHPDTPITYFTLFFKIRGESCNLHSVLSQQQCTSKEPTGFAEKSSRWRMRASFGSPMWFHNRSSSSHTINWQLQFLSQSHLCCTSVQLLFPEYHSLQFGLTTPLPLWTLKPDWSDKWGSLRWHGMSRPSLEVRDLCMLGLRTKPTCLPII